MRAGLRLCVLLMAVVVAAGSTVAEDPPVWPSDASRVDPQAGNRDVVEKLNLARKLVRDRNYQGASAVLEVLYEQNPDDQRLYNQLRTCYLQLRYYDKLEALSRHYIARYPGVLTYRTALAETFMAKGLRDSAAAAYQRAVDVQAPDAVNNLKSIARSMNAVGLWEESADVIDQVRSQTGDTTLLALQKGQAMESLKLYGPAATELFVAMTDSSRDANTAAKRLLDLLSFEAATEEAEAVLLDLSEKHQDQRAMKLLATHFLRTDQFDQAFKYAILEDSLEGLAGKRLISFMHDCHDRSLWNETVTLGEYVSRRYPDSSIIEEAYLLHADALSNLGRYDAAIAKYDTLFARTPLPAGRSEALYRIAMIHSERLFDYHTALNYLDSVVTHYRAGMGFFRAQLARPFCYLRMGDLTSAHDAFVQLQGRRLNEDMMEEVTYHLALVQFFQKQVDSARAGLNRVLVNYPRGYYFNDAIRLLLLFDEAGEAEDLLYDYSNALLFEYRRMTDSAMTAYARIVGADDQALADISVYRLSELALTEQDSVSAMKYLDQLIQDYPQSYYYPYGLKIKADVLVQDPGEIDRAREIYRRILKEFSNYPFVAEVRQKLRELEIDKNIG